MLDNTYNKAPTIVIMRRDTYLDVLEENEGQAIIQEL